MTRDLDRLQQVRIHYRAADWLVRTDAAPDVTRLFKCAHVALPSRARQARHRRHSSPNSHENAAATQGVSATQLEFRRNANVINSLYKSGVQVGKNFLSACNRYILVTYCSCLLYRGQDHCIEFVKPVGKACTCSRTCRARDF